MKVPLKTGQGLQDLSGFFSAFFGISLTAGIVLYYIVPFFPFLFFFFGMITWVKSIFEAMVGVPLWALAHLRIQGNGLPGQAASSGYYLIFEIFLRPILIVFGLLAASIIFFTEVYLLHIVFDLVTENLAGSDPRCAQVEATNAADLSTGCLDINGNPVVQLIENVRSSVDQYFFTIVYVILVYLMASSTFKMIDAVPNKILRWMGAAVDTYADNSGDPTQNLTRNVGISGSMIGRQIGGAVPQVFGGIGAGAGKVGKALH